MANKSFLTKRSALLSKLLQPLLFDSWWREVLTLMASAAPQPMFEGVVEWLLAANLGDDASGANFEIAARFAAERLESQETLTIREKIRGVREAKLLCEVRSLGSLSLQLRRARLEEVRELTIPFEAVAAAVVSLHTASPLPPDTLIAFLESMRELHAQDVRGEGHTDAQYDGAARWIAGNLLFSPHADLGAAAAQTLSVLGSRTQEVQFGLLQMLSESEPAVIGAAAQALLSLGLLELSELVDELRKRFNSSREGARQSADWAEIAACLASIFPADDEEVAKEIGELLDRALRHPMASVVVAASVALVSCGGEEHLEAFFRAEVLGDEEGLEAEGLSGAVAASELRAARGSSTSFGAFERLRQFADSAAESGRSVGWPRSIFLQALSHDHPRIRAAAASALHADLRASASSSPTPAFSSDSRRGEDGGKRSQLKVRSDSAFFMSPSSKLRGGGGGGDEPSSPSHYDSDAGVLAALVSSCSDRSETVVLAAISALKSHATAAGRSSSFTTPSGEVSPLASAVLTLEALLEDDRRAVMSEALDALSALAPASAALRAKALSLIEADAVASNLLHDNDGEVDVQLRSVAVRTKTSLNATCHAHSRPHTDTCHF